MIGLENLSKIAKIILDKEKKVGVNMIKKEEKDSENNMMQIQFHKNNMMITVLKLVVDIIIYRVIKQEANLII